MQCFRHIHQRFHGAVARQKSARARRRPFSLNGVLRTGSMSKPSSLPSCCTALVISDAGAPTMRMRPVKPRAARTSSSAPPRFLRRRVRPRRGRADTRREAQRHRRHAQACGRRIPPLQGFTQQLLQVRLVDNARARRDLPPVRTSGFPPRPLVRSVVGASLLPQNSYGATTIRERIRGFSINSG